jgi:hypothetical protein
MASLFPVRKSYALLGVIACVGWIFFFFRSEYFDLKGIEVQTSGGFISSADVLPIVFRTLDDQPSRPWSKRQQFFLPKREIEEGIKTALYAERVEVGEVSDNILRLKISFGSRFLYTTEDGEVFQKCAVARPAGIALDEPAVLSAAKKRYLSIDFTTQALDGLVYVRNTTSTLDVPTIKALLDLGRLLDEHKIRFSHLKELTGKDVSIQLDGNREVLIDLGQPLRDQIERCQAILRDKDYLELKPSVIDLRIPGRAYLR